MIILRYIDQAQQTNTCSGSTKETVEQGVKYVQSRRYVLKNFFYIMPS